MATLKIRQADGSWAIVEDFSGVKYINQNLTDEQKRIARENIGALSTGDINNKLDKLTNTGSGTRLYAYYGTTQSSIGVDSSGYREVGTIAKFNNETTDAPVANRGYLTSSEPTKAGHVATKNYVDTGFLKKLAPHERLSTIIGMYSKSVEGKEGEEYRIYLDTFSEAIMYSIPHYSDGGDNIINSSPNFGNLVSAEPTKPAQVATKNYVDTGLGNKLDKIVSTGGIYLYATAPYGQTKVLTDPLGESNGRVPRYVNQSEIDAPVRATGAVLTSGEPTQPAHVATKNYVDTQVLNKTSVTIKGEHQDEFNADTKIDKPSGTQEFGIVPFFNNKSATQAWKNVGVSKYSAKAGAIPAYVSTTNSDGDEAVEGALLTTTPTKISHCANKKYVDDAIDTYDISAKEYVNEAIDTYDISAKEYIEEYTEANYIKKNAESQMITGNISVTGNLTVQGQTFTQDNETIRIADNIIELNSNKLDNSTALSGIAINKNSTSTYGIMYNPTTNTVDLGEGTVNNDGEFAYKTNEGSPLAIRDNSDNIADGAIMIFKKYDENGKEINKLVDSGFTIESMKQWVREYVESYMSTEIFITEDEQGYQTAVLTATERVINNPDGSQTLIIGG